MLGLNGKKTTTARGPYHPETLVPVIDLITHLKQFDLEFIDMNQVEN
jgi:hypothetical protein